jgi:acylphosphatase
MKAVRIVVRGRVQGVGYRDWAIGEARPLGIPGWVRNRGDGGVEIHAVGDAEAVAALIEKCRRGPWAARVTKVTTSPAEAEPLTEFSRRPTV